MSASRVAISIHVFGLVQGVGFRPFLHRIASQHGVSGWAVNTNDSVRIHAEGLSKAIDDFIDSIRRKSPPLAHVEHIETRPATDNGYTAFEIHSSRSETTAVTRVSPDIAVCDECLADIKVQPNRINYPFVNCTNCGPRFSIIKDLPYDRGNTTMADFKMCESCSREYGDIENRRYHAQPNACAECGPVYTYQTGEETVTDINLLLSRAASLIDRGGVIAVKGIGGFHLACDATNETAVSRLRVGKRREGKPFAIMCGDLKAAREYAYLSLPEEELLVSRERPIVLLASKRKGNGVPLAASVCNGLPTVGIMIPYMPLHFLLFERLETKAIVLTSGNLSDEPIAIGNEDAFERLGSTADAFLTTNREIHNRNDDSVLFVAGGIPRFVRRSRGWAPEPVPLPFSAEGVAACGAELKGSFCLGKGNSAILSQHLGDLKNPESFSFYTEAFERFCRLFRFSPRLAVCDTHPDYLSTRFAESLDVPIMKVQHHYAHIASCLAENAFLDRVIGVAMDGTGYGDDGNIWGGEFFLCDLTGYRRISHLQYLPLPGGDAAIREPWRMAVGLLYSLYGKSAVEMDLPVLRERSDAELELLIAAIEKGVNTPITSSAGRLFDGVAALTGLVSKAGFEAEAPMRLEASIACDDTSYSFKTGDRIGVLSIIEEIVADICAGIDTGVIASRFHNTVVRLILDTVVKIAEESGVRTVALSGGVFQNRYIVSKTEESLSAEGFTVLRQRMVPVNDEGVSLGQLAVAAFAGAGQ